MRAAPRPGLYLHVPFCVHRCGYCDFNVATGSDAALRTRYAAALSRRVTQIAAAGPGAVEPGRLAGAGDPWPVFGSVFIGGGTPTLLDSDDLAGILRRVFAVLPMAPDVEVTVEANPETVTDAGALRPLVDAGLTRLSLGAQSTSTAVLDQLERRHDPDTVPRAIAAARAAGVDQVAVDLIYGTPGETDEQWRRSLADVLDAGVDHVSAYALTLAPNTPYAREVAAGTKAAPDDDVAADRMEVAASVLAAAGLERYEVSNWARSGARCRHNLSTWRGGDYLAAGAGAHGRWAGRRWWEIRATSAWLRGVEGSGRVVGGSEIVDSEQHRAERLLTGLRITEGVTRDEVAPIDEAALGTLVQAGLLVDEAGRLRATRDGLARVDGMALALLP